MASWLTADRGASGVSPDEAGSEKAVEPAPLLACDRPVRGKRPQIAAPGDEVRKASDIDRMATDRHAMLSYHFPWPGMGHVAKAAPGAGFAWVPAPMNTGSVG